VLVAVLDGQRVEPFQEWFRVGVDDLTLRVVPRHGEGRDDRPDDLPARRHARPGQQVGQLGEDETHRGGRGDRVAEGDRGVVAGGEHAGSGGDQLVERAVRRGQARTPPVESLREPVQSFQDPQPAADPRSVGRLCGVETGQRGGRADGVERPGQRRVAGHGLVARGPERQALSQFVDEQRIGARAGRSQRPDGVRGPDHAMGRAGREPRQQARPPAQQQRAPVGIGGVAAQVGGPVAEEPRVAEVEAPVVADPADDLGRGVEPDAVAVDPARHRVGRPDADERLRGHRAVVGQEAVELGAGATQPVQGVEQDVVAHPISVRPVWRRRHSTKRSR
jgi:hypothetical protein